MLTPEAPSVVPSGHILKVLKGTVIGPVETLSEKPTTKGQTVSVYLASEGSGMVGLEDAGDNREWAGILNHILKTARIATFLSEELKESGEEVDTGTLLNTILVSHSGRRQYDEATWYPAVVQDSGAKKQAGDTQIALELLEKAGVLPTIIENVRAHGVGTTYPISQMDTWEKKLALYADFRVSQGVMPLAERFEDLAKRAVPAGRLTQEQLDAIRKFEEGVEKEIFEKLTSSGLNPEDLTDDYPPMPRWERYLRRLYIHDAEGGIFGQIRTLRPDIPHRHAWRFLDRYVDHEFWKAFPPNSWWAKDVIRSYRKQRGHPYRSKHGKPPGMERAIDFFAYLDSERRNKIGACN